MEDVALTGKGLTLSTQDSPDPWEFAAVPLAGSGLGDFSGVLTPVGLALPGDIPDSGLEGRIALAKRGAIRFQNKAENVLAAGAVGLVIYNSSSRNSRGVLVTQPEFPVLSISGDAGEEIEQLLAESDVQESIKLTDLIKAAQMQAGEEVAVTRGIRGGTSDFASF